jgi:non-ribosomal peptide synthetase component F
MLNGQNVLVTGGTGRNLAMNGRTERAYYTGDWAERRNRHVFFKHRIDFQVKIRGYRVELDEVATATIARLEQEMGLIA